MRQDDDRTQINRQMAKMKKKDRDFFVTNFFAQWCCAVFFGITKMFTIFDCQFSISHEAKRCSIFDFLLFRFFLWFLWISHWDFISTWNSQVTCKLFGCIPFFRNVNNFRKGSTNLFQLIPLELQLRMIVVKLFFLYFSHLLHAYHIDPTKNLIEQHGSNYFKLNTYIYAQFGVDVC